MSSSKPCLSDVGISYMNSFCHSSLSWARSLDGLRLFKSILATSILVLFGLSVMPPNQTTKNLFEFRGGTSVGSTKIAICPTPMFPQVSTCEDVHKFPSHLYHVLAEA